MPCEHFSGPGFQLFSCGRRRPVVCAWPLRGPKAGQTCGRPALHSIGMGVELCNAHLRRYEKGGRVWPPRLAAKRAEP